MLWLVSALTVTSVMCWHIFRLCQSPVHAFDDSSVIDALSSVGVVVLGIYRIFSTTRNWCNSRLAIIFKTPAIIPTVLRSPVFD